MSRNSHPTLALSAAVANDEAKPVDHQTLEVLPETPRSPGIESDGSFFTFYGNRGLRSAIDGFSRLVGTATEAEAMNEIMAMVKAESCAACISLAHVGYYLLVPPLHYSIWSGCVPLVDRIARENLTYLNMPDDADGQAPLYWACENNKPDVVQRLIELGANVNQADRFGNTPTHIAATLGHTACLHVLCETANSEGQILDLNALNQKGETPLRLSVLNNRTDCQTYLTQQGGTLGVTQTTTIRERFPFRRSLSDFGAVAARYQREAISSHSTPDISRDLARAIESGDTDSIHALASRSDCSGEVLVKLCGEEQSVPVLQYAASFSQAALEAVFAHFPDQLNKGADQQTALGCAARDNRPENIAFLLSKDADATLMDDKGNTPLHIAAQKGNLPCIQAFQAAGLNLNGRNKEGFTPMWLALSENRPDCLNYFVEQRACFTTDDPTQTLDSASIEKYIKKLNAYQIRYFAENRSTTLTSRAESRIKAEAERFKQEQSRVTTEQARDGIAEVSNQLSESAKSQTKSETRNAGVNVIASLALMAGSIYVMCVNKRDKGSDAEFFTALFAGIGGLISCVYGLYTVKTNCSSARNTAKAATTPGMFSSSAASPTSPTDAPIRRVRSSGRR